MKHSRLLSLMLLTIGLSLWTLAPYGGCACNNPMGPSDGPTPTPSPTQGPFVDNWEDGDFINNWSGSTTANADTLGSTVSLTLSNNGNTAGTPGHCAQIYGTILKDGPPYPSVAMPIGLGGPRDMLTSFSSYNGVQLAYKWGGSSVPAGASFFVIVATPLTITDYGWFRYQVFPPDNAWHTLNIYFPNKAGTPKFAQPSWGASRPWTTGSPPSGTDVERIEISIQARAGISTDYDVSIDDVTFF